MSAEQVRRLILSCLELPLGAMGLSAHQVGDDFDLRAEGLIDSLGFVELITGLEERLGCQIDFSDLDLEGLTVIGPLSRYISVFSASANGNSALASDRSRGALSS